MTGASADSPEVPISTEGIESLEPLAHAEWIETDGLGGFASGTTALVRTRRYHALLLVPTRPPGGRMVLVNGVEAWLETSGGRFALSTHRYAPDVTYPDGAKYITTFHARPWPQWEFALPDGTRVEHGIVSATGRSSTLVYWRLIQGSSAILTVRPLMSGRDYTLLFITKTQRSISTRR